MILEMPEGGTGCPWAANTAAWGKGGGGWLGGGYGGEQGVRGGEPVVAGAGVVAPVLLEVAEEGDDPVEGEVAEREAGDLAAFVCCGEQEEQPHGVAVAAHRGGAEAFYRGQGAGGEGVQDRGEGRGFGARAAWVQAGAANGPDRRPGSSTQRAGLLKA